MDAPSATTILVLLATLGVTLWGGFVLGPRRVVPPLLLLGPLFLPAHGKIDLAGLPSIDRVTAVTIPTALLLWFSPRSCWQRFRPVLPDAFLATFVVWSVVCTGVNQGAYAGVAKALSQVMTLVMPYAAGRLYVQRERDLVNLVKVAVPFVLVYVVLMAFEARMYPRFQNWVYGRNVIGLYRFGLYRPIVFAQNALELGHTMVLLTVVMLAVRRAGGEARKAAGKLLDFGIVAGCTAVLLSLSRGPILSLGLAVALPLLLRRSGWLACLTGSAGVLFLAWMLSPAGSVLVAGMALTDASTESGQTLFYRFLQIEAFKPMVAASPLFGYGESWSREQMSIIDGELLLTVLGYGYPGMVLLAAFWLSATWQLGQRSFPRRDAFRQLGAVLAPVIGWLVFSAWGDAFLRAPHYLILGGALGAMSAARSPAEDDSLVTNPIRTVVFRYG